MPPFRKPKPAYNYKIQTEKEAVDDWFRERKVPRSKRGHLLLASWNIANLGSQRRTDKDLDLIAHMLKRFDLVAVQEVNDNYADFADVAMFMGPEFGWIMNDTAGNNERLGFIYRQPKVEPRQLFGEVAFNKNSYIKRDVLVHYKKRGQIHTEVYSDLEFEPFDRNPFIGTFKADNLDFTLVNVHLYFGAFKNSSTMAERLKYARRVLEIFALSNWAEKRVKDKNTYDKDIILIGDMNVPEMATSEAAYSALLSSGLRPIQYHTKTGGSNLTGSKTYDQLAITPGNMQKRVLEYDAFDFDNAIFQGKWEQLGKDKKLTEKQRVSKFNSYVKYHVSDHRLIWAQIRTSGT